MYIGIRLRKEMVLYLVLVRHTWGFVFLVKQPCSLEHLQRKEKEPKENRGKQHPPSKTGRAVKRKVN